MGPKFTYILLAVIFIASMVTFFLVNPSYEKSLEAKYHYVLGEYLEAHQLASEAATLDTYNKMAITIISQSERALKYVHFIDESKKYMRRIEKIALNKEITLSEQAKIKIMCQIIIEQYQKLSSTAITDKNLVIEAKEYNDRFIALYEKITSRV